MAAGPHQTPFGAASPRVRLPDDTRIGAVRLQVGDLQRSIDYYEEVLGLRAVRVRGSLTADLAPLDDDRVLVSLHAKPGITPAPRRGAFGLFHFALLLPDRASLGRFVSHLARLGVRAGSADHVVSESMYLTDPDGLGIEVYADRPRNTWRHVDRELVMATEPLDLASVRAAGGDREWTGAPDGTTMGHVHLHVGDLGEAARFYSAILGFDLTVWSYPGALFFAAGGYHHHLGTNTWAPGPSATDDQARLLDWELVVPGPDAAAAAAQRLASAGSSVNPDGDSWSAADPWGIRLRIVTPAV